MPFTFKRLEIPDVILIEPQVFSDERGFFTETYKYPDFSQFGIKEQFLQDSQSRSAKGTVRGLHYQKNPMAQAKLVRAARGEIFDVAVDIRKGSGYYGKWISMVLSAENKKILYIPAGFAHGFCALSEGSELFYKFSNIYSKEHERGIIWDDPQIGIAWPVKKPLLSEKDSGFPVLAGADNNFTYPGK